MTTVTAILGSSGECVAVDPDRLVWRLGYPSHDGETWLQHAHWSQHWDPKQEVRLASLHGAIVRDAVSQLVIDSPGVCHYDHHTAEYGFVPGDHRLHHPYFAWRVVRESDGTVLYDSLTAAGEYWRVVHSDVPLGWGNVIRQLINDGHLPHCR